MILQNQRLLAEICDNTGALVRLMDKRSGMEFVNVLPETACRVVARYERNGQLTGDTTFQPEDASVQPLENGAALCWNMAQGITVHASIALEEDGLSFRSYADCGPKTQLQLVEYPVIGGMDDWNGAEMIHSFATGLRVKEPLKHFKPGEGVRYAPYPECFSGASMQFYAYYAPGRGGLLFMAEDGESHQKWLNLYRNGDSMEATMMYGFEEMGMGKSFRADYSFKVRLLQGNGWSEPASLYKQWAVRQPWCSMGRLNDREHCEWLLKKVGLSTFGVCAGQDRSNYIRRYHKDANTSVFHVLGPDWAHTTQSFSGHNPGYSLAGWMPTNFRQANLEAIREVGDYFAPFEFDLFGHARAEESDEIKRKAEANRQLFPEKGHTYSCDAYDFFMMCPCEEHTHDMHVARDKQIVAESGANAMYYDIEYVEDPATKKRIPTVNRAQFTSIFADDDYKSALEYADSVQKGIYETEAKAIDDIQKGILDISKKEKPFDVFICYKKTDAEGNCFFPGIVVLLFARAVSPVYQGRLLPIGLALQSLKHSKIKPWSLMPM